MKLKVIFLNRHFLRIRTSSAEDEKQNILPNSNFASFELVMINLIIISLKFDS
jgi:hypothetical protein